MLGQTFAMDDLLGVSVLAGLEGLLSIDNAVVLGLLVRRVPERLRSRALTYGLAGSVVFRLAAVVAAAWLLRFGVVKLLGGGYLLYVAGRHLLWERRTATPPVHMPQPAATSSQFFWRTVGSIELTDAAFAVDSVLAGIALIGPPPDHTPANAVHPKLWVVVGGGMIGVVLMRFAAAGFAKLISRFPRFELAAHLMVLVVGLKLLVDYGLNLAGHQARFQSPSSPAFWTFWVAMAASAAVGFIPVPRGVVTPAHGS
jgi:YkoY family integral membrane protein